MSKPARPIDRLLARLRKATAARGSRSELARWLDVPRQQVNTWLVGISEPGGNATLLILAWLKLEAAKAKRRRVRKSAKRQGRGR
ncbi:MAG: hypothetical protein JWR69_2253 [Pedosphaera sp.]|nr:hypothetical protein [Pedosphaera sp.]